MVPTNLFGEEQELPEKLPRKSPIRIPQYNDKPLMPDRLGGMGKLEMKFWIFHDKNPFVYRRLVYFAHQWRDMRGPTATTGIEALYERVRWDLNIKTKDKSFKLNNNHRAFYARLIMDNEPGLAGIFDLRRQRMQATFGPPGDKLPSGEHVA
jgi:hypothetical protein